MAFNFSTLYKQFITWTGRRDNPHGVTAAQANAYTKTEINAIAELRLPRGIVPVRSYGSLDGSLPTISWVNGTLTIPTAVPAVLYGDAQIVAAGTINFSALRDGTVYLYLKYENTKIVYAASDVLLPESHTAMMIAYGTKAGSTISGFKLEQVRCIDLYRVSSTKRGGAIPVSTGSPAEQGQFAW